MSIFCIQGTVTWANLKMVVITGLRERKTIVLQVYTNIQALMCSLLSFYQ